MYKTKFLVRILCVVNLLILFSSCTESEYRSLYGDLEGKIVFSDLIGTPYNFVQGSMFVQVSNGKVSYNAIPDEFGQFNFHQLPTGIYTLDILNHDSLPVYSLADCQILGGEVPVNVTFEYCIQPDFHDLNVNYVLINNELWLKGNISMDSNTLFKANYLRYSIENKETGWPRSYYFMVDQVTGNFNLQITDNIYSQWQSGDTVKAFMFQKFKYLRFVFFNYVAHNSNLGFIDYNSVNYSIQKSDSVALPLFIIP